VCKAQGGICRVNKFFQSLSLLFFVKPKTYQPPLASRKFAHTNFYNEAYKLGEGFVVTGTETRSTGIHSEQKRARGNENENK
jgi:hypothetical protein